MILGMSTSTFTLLHVLISLLGIGAGLVMMYGILTANRMDRWTALFLVSTAATSLTGFAFPNSHITPGIVVGILSLAVLALAIVARYGLRLKGLWRPIFVITAALALYFNVFVLVVQSIEPPLDFKRFDEVVNSKFDEVETRMVNGRPMISDEQTLADQEFDQACEAFIAAEQAFNKVAMQKDKPNFDVCLWFDLLEVRYQAEKRLWTLFCAGDRSLVTGQLYLQFRDMLFNRVPLKANA